MIVLKPAVALPPNCVIPARTLLSPLPRLVKTLPLAVEFVAVGHSAVWGDDDVPIHLQIPVRLDRHLACQHAIASNVQVARDGHPTAILNGERARCSAPSVGGPTTTSPATFHFASLTVTKP